MDLDKNRHWPFDVLAPDQRTEQHRHEIRFLETAFREGFGPYMFGTQNFGASTPDRNGVILYRRHRWDVLLGGGADETISFFLDEFGQAADAILSWLRGGDRAELVDRFQGRSAARAGKTPPRQPSTPNAQGTDANGGVQGVPAPLTRQDVG